MHAPTLILFGAALVGFAPADDQPTAEDCLLEPSENEARRHVTGCEPVPTRQTAATAANIPSGKKHALIICGLPGDDDHRTLFAASIRSLHESLTTRLKFSPADVRILFGDEPNEDNAEPLISARGLSTREEIANQAADLKASLEPQDTLWVLVLGHAHFDGRRSWLNLPGPDIHELDFAKLFVGLPPRRQVFFITTPVSGFYIRPLSAKGRVVITATEADREVNETVFHEMLAESLATLGEDPQADLNNDGAISLFELYIDVTRKVADSFLADELLATEHAQLDDNGDRHGSEVQIDYLTREQGGRADEGSKPPPLKPAADGFTAAAIPLFPVARPQPAPLKGSRQK